MIGRVLSLLVQPAAKDLFLGGLAATVLAAVTLIGLSWLSAAAFQALKTSMDTPSAMAIVGGVCLVPALATALVLLVSRWRAARALREDARRERDAAPAVALLPQIVETAHDLTRRNPLSALAVCAVGGWVAAAHPKAAGDVAHQILQSLKSMDVPPEGRR